MNNFKKYSIFLVLLIVGIFSFQESKASVEIQQPIFSTSTNPGLAPNVGIQTLGQLPAGLTFDSIETKYKVWSVSGGIIGTRQFVSKCTIPWIETGSGICGGGQTDLGGNNLYYDHVGDYSTTTTFTATTTDGLGYWAILIRSFQSFTGSTISIKGSANPNSYPNGQTDNGVCNGGLCDIYFRIGTNLPSTESNGDFIEIVYPEDGSAIPNFAYWNTLYQLTSTTTGTIHFDISVATSTTILNSIDHTEEGQLPYTTRNQVYVGPAQTINGGGNTLNNIPTLPAGDYYAKAYGLFTDLNGNTTIIVSSETILFSITGGTNPLFNPEGQFTFSTTTGDIQNQCEQSFVNDWQVGVCNVFAFLFQPHQFSLNAIQGVLTQFKQVFPFSIVFNTLSQIESAIDTNMTTSYSLCMPIFINGDCITLLSPTIFEDYFGTTAKDIFFQTQQYIFSISLILIILKIIL